MGTFKQWKDLEDMFLERFFMNTHFMERRVEILTLNKVILNPCLILGRDLNCYPKDVQITTWVVWTYATFHKRSSSANKNATGCLGYRYNQNKEWWQSERVNRENVLEWISLTKWKRSHAKWCTRNRWQQSSVSLTRGN